MFLKTDNYIQGKSVRVRVRPFWSHICLESKPKSAIRAKSESDSESGASIRARARPVAEEGWFVVTPQGLCRDCGLHVVRVQLYAVGTA